MVEKSYLGLTIDGTPVYRIANSLFKEENDTFIKMEESEIEDFILGQYSGDDSEDEDDYSDQFYNYNFAPVEELLGDKRITS